MLGCWGVAAGCRVEGGVGGVSKVCITVWVIMEVYY